MLKGIKIIETDHDGEESPVAELRMDPGGAVVLASGDAGVMGLMKGVRLHQREMPIAAELGREYGVEMPAARADHASLITPMNGAAFLIAVMMHLSRSSSTHVEPIEE